MQLLVRTPMRILTIFVSPLQRTAIALADVLLAPAAVLRFMSKQGWRTPALVGTMRRHRPRMAIGALEGVAQIIATQVCNAQQLIHLWARLPEQARQRANAVGNVEKQRPLGWVAGLSTGAGHQHRHRRFRCHRPSSSVNGSTNAASVKASSDPILPWVYDARSCKILVSVCLVHHERGQLLLQALASIREQTLPASHVQVIVVDDGSTSFVSLKILEDVIVWDEFRSGRWLLLRGTSRYLGASRNDAVRHASGEYVYFLDDDNILKPHALYTLLLAAAATRAHILTSPNEKWPSLDPPPTQDAHSERWIPLGNAASVGIFRNCFGDASALVRREEFVRLGGFTEDPDVGHEDWELWAYAVLRGYRLQVVPEALYWYRTALGRNGAMLAESLGASQLARTQWHANHARNARPYLQRLARLPQSQEAVLLAQGLYANLRFVE